MSNVLNLPVLFIGSQGNLNVFLNSGFTKQEIRRVRRYKDILGIKDTILFCGQEASYYNFPDYQDILEYATTHNIKTVRV